MKWYVCSRKVFVDGQFIEASLEIENGKKVEIIGGCAGNTMGVSVLVQGMNINEAIKRLRGIDCRGRGTSCPDQLAIALEKIKEEIA